ncbi:MAG: type IV toxin-antitoxin system AbiEi family antitoxin domain-containing protein [Candidatus Jordarchaeum sp.]|uniref:type IV toxin-antitoxin system AbiEi family antitoxin domain-containing protein n=1 Tax=Candidatus Jordarchaeum sp. TaxID=2823881 RepID=UPI004049D29D
MVSKTERLYLELLASGVVAFEDIVDKLGDITGKSYDAKYVYSKYVGRLMEEGKLARIRRGLYAVVPPLEKPEEYLPDKFLVGSRIRERYYLGYHTALEFYGCAYSFFNEVYVVVGKSGRFDAFYYKNLRFRPVFLEDLNLGVEEKRYLNQVIRVSSKERTFVDCVDRVEYAGGWVEALKSLQSLSGVSFDKLFVVLSLYNKDFLFRKVGFILEFLRETSVFYENVSGELSESIRERVGKTPMYLEKNSSLYYDRNWNLYVPRDFKSLVRGV